MEFYNTPIFIYGEFHDFTPNMPVLIKALCADKSQRLNSPRLGHVLRKL